MTAYRLLLTFVLGLTV